MAAKKPPAEASVNPPPDTGGAATAVLDLPGASGPPSVDVDGMHIEAADGGDLNVTASAAQAPVEAPEHGEALPIGWSELAGQKVSYSFDQDGRARGAEIRMWKYTPGYTSSQHYHARIRWEAGAFYWYEEDPDQATGWKRVKRGHDPVRLQPIVDQAIEYALNRVFSNGWIN